MNVPALKNIDAAFLQSLLDNAVHENKHLEYKSKISDDNKANFLAGVTAFANSQGGVILIGVEEDRDTGAAKSISGIQSENPDQEALRIEQVIRNGSEPKIRGIEIKPIAWNDCYVYCVWIPKSWSAPHRVTLKDHSKFYSRNSAGKYPMDVFELREAFLQSEELPNRIRAFRSNRIEKIMKRHELPVELAQGTMLVMHLLPLASFLKDQSVTIDIENKQACLKLYPLGAYSWNSRLNLDGIVTFSGEHEKECIKYTQLFRSGIIESVGLIGSKNHDTIIIPHTGYEEEIVKCFKSYIEYYSSVKVNTVIYCFITLINTLNSRLSWSDTFPGRTLICDRSVLSLPEIVIEDMSLPAHTLLKPCFDLIWNAYGFPRSMNYDEEGNWKPQR